MARLRLGRYGPWYFKRTLNLQPPGVATHKHVIGTTGQGKSKFLAHAFVELVSQGVACSLLDPHSDLADDVLGMLADRGLANDRLLFIDFGRRDRFVPFNVLRQPYPPDKLASMLVEACKRVWPALADGSAPMFENVMLAAGRTLVQNDLPFPAISLLITDKRYRDRLLANVSDPLVVHYFQATFDRLSVKDQLDQTASSLRRVFNLSFPEELRYSLGQPDNLLDFQRIMDGGYPAIYDLGGLDEEAQKFLGALITHGYERAAKARSDTPEHLRVPHHLFIDEFPRFASTSEESLGNILSEARKYKLTLWLAHQTWGQLSPRIANALQNTTRIAFALGFTDARIMAPVFTTFDPLLVKIAEGDDRTIQQFYGVQDTFEAMATELQHLKPRYAYVRYPWLERFWWFWRKPAIRITKMKTLPVPPRTISDQALLGLREVYAKNLLRAREDVVPGVDDLVTASEEEGPPPSRERGC